MESNSPRVLPDRNPERFDAAGNETGGIGLVFVALIVWNVFLTFLVIYLYKVSGLSVWDAVKP